MVPLLLAAACFPCVIDLPAPRGLDIADERSVLRHVFAHLAPEVVVYPSENHYYFSFPVGRDQVRGNLWLEVESRDKGILSLSYTTYRQGERGENFWRDFGPPDLTLTRLRPLHYSATFEGRAVQFRLHPLSARPPARMKLRPGEAYVGPAFDDSGLQFALLFFERYKHFHWILNQDEPVPETLAPRGQHLVAGSKSGFVYYRDRENNRLILVGVRGKQTLINGPFDGPFDQLPDNLIETGEVDLWKYLAQYMDHPDAIDKYGRSRDAPGIRTSIMPYLDYDHPGDLDWVERCRKRRAGTPDLFYACLAGAEP